MAGPISDTNAPKLRRILRLTATDFLPWTSCSMSLISEMRPSMYILRKVPKCTGGRVLPLPLARARSTFFKAATP